MTPAPPRPEYEALARDFRALAAPFGVIVDDARQADLVLLGAAFETADRHVDATADAGERGRLCEAIVRALEEGRDDPRVAGDLRPVLAALRGRLVALGALARFLPHLAWFFVRTEALRRAPTSAGYLRCALDEARAAAEMTLLVLHAAGTPRFARFFRVLSEVANLTDKLHDVTGDHARGEIAVHPGLWLRLRLLAAFVRRALTLLVLAPRPLHLVAWGMGYVRPREVVTSRDSVAVPTGFHS
jgi:hypothetical protein